jgi:phosphoglycolate phosphatase-like HAD superfamily hydrolase
VREFSVLFWDFDGVIKESVEVKSDAYVRLFGRTAELAARVRAHHESNGGTSRFEKVPLYLSWGGIPASDAAVAGYCAAFAAAVRQGVLDAPWVPGAREYLEANCARQRCVLVSATPQAEIMDILGALGIGACFREVHGAPTPKAEAITSVLRSWACSPAQALVIGDSYSDYQAAVGAGVGFLLRRTPFNRALQQSYHGRQCENFLHEQMGND